MSTQFQEDKFAGAREQAQAQYESIKEMVQDLQCAESNADPAADTAEDARQRIQEDALSVEVRSGWVIPGAWDAAHGRDQAKPEEYCILLCTGGPAVRIVGKLNDYCEPETARLEMQDWFLPWTEHTILSTTQTGSDGPYRDPDAEDTLLAYARCFWFGE